MAKHLSLQFTGAAQPFLYVPLQTLTGSGTSIQLNAGSIWFFGPKLTTSAPANSFAGLTIQNGTIKFTSSVPISTNPIMVPISVTVLLTLKLVPATPTTPGLPDASVTTPSDVTFTFTQASGALTSAGNGVFTAFGTTVNLTFDPSGTGSYDPPFNRLVFPYKASASSFSVAKSNLKTAVFSGSATILRSAWALRVSTSTIPDNLGNAPDAGGVELLLSAGLQATLKGRDGPLDMGSCEIIVEPNLLTINSSAAQSTIDQAQLISLWAQSTISFRLPQRGGVKFQLAVQSRGDQVWLLGGNGTATFDAPRTVDNSRLRLQGPGSIGMASDPTGALTFVVDIKSNLVRSPHSYALKNLLLQLNGPNLLVVRGLFDVGASKIATGSAQLSYDFNAATSFLPDPYTTSANIVTPPSLLNVAASPITIALSWQPGSPVVIDISISRPPSVTTTTKQSETSAPSAGVVSPELPGVTMLDLSSNVSQFGVAFAAQERGPQTQIKITDLYLQAPASDLRVVALPAVQWEPVLTPDQTISFPSPLSYPDCGPVTQLGTKSVTLTPIAPRQTLDEIITAYNSGSAGVAAKFTLPFGIVANATLTPSNPFPFPSPILTQVQPIFSAMNLKGTDQVSIRPRQSLIISPVPRPSPSLAGSMTMRKVALDQNGQPTNMTILSPSIDIDPTFAVGGKRPGVPVTRVDLSGYGESLFSDWRDPSGDAATICKVNFEVMVGRTSREVVQIFSVLYPYAVRVVRTVTIERQNGGSVTRADSGWQAVSNGTYAYPNPGIVTNPGVVRGVDRVTNIRDSGQFYTTPDSTKTKLMGVRFDCGIRMENVVTGQGSDGLVPATDQLGYVQTEPPGELTAEQYAGLISAVGQLGGHIDCTINIGGSGMNMRVIRVGVSATRAIPPTSPQFAMAAWGSPVLPAGGQWSCVRIINKSAPQHLDPSDGVPVIRAGPSTAPAPAGNPYRFADPVDVLTATVSTSTYGIVHSTGTQRLLFLAPQIETTTPFAVTSLVTPVLADPFALGTATGPFPDLSLAIRFNNADFRLFIRSGGNLTLQLPSFTAHSPPRVLRQSQTFSSIAYTADENGNPSVVTIAIDTTAVAPAKTWSLSITNLSLATETGSLGEVMRVVGSVNADSHTATSFTESRLVFGKPLKPVTALISFLENFGPLAPLTMSMTNDWSVQAGQKISLKDFLEEIPALKEFLEKFVDDFDLKFLSKTSPDSSSFVFTIELTIKVPTSFGPVAIGIAAVEFDLSDSGAIWQFTLGVGIGVGFDVGPFHTLAYYAQTQTLITGDNVFGIGAGSLIKGSIDLEIVSVEISVEAKIEMLKVTCNTTDSSIWGIAQVTFAIDITIFWIIDIEFDAQAQWTNNFDSGPCPMPDV